MNSILKYNEEIVRTYSNFVTITYEYIDNATIYINLIRSDIPNKGNGTQAMNQFLYENKEYNIYIFSSNELGTAKEILDKWYKSLGFVECDNINFKYNVTHVKKRNV